MRADARAKRAAIIAAARRLMAADGVDVALTAVAQAAGVGIGTLYRHFPARDDLMVAVALDLRDSLLAIAIGARESLDGHPDPAIVWREAVHKLSAQRPGAIFPEIVGRLDSRLHSAALAPEALGTVEGLLERAREHALIDNSLTAQKFIAAIGMLTRPLPTAVRDIVEADQSWLIDVYIRGIRPER